MDGRDSVGRLRRQGQAVLGRASSHQSQHLLCVFRAL